MVEALARPFDTQSNRVYTGCTVPAYKRAQMKRQQTSRLSIRIPRDLHHAALERARRQDLTLSQVVRHYLRDWVEEDLPEEDEQEH
jgi:hypothetical protein